VPPKSKPVTRAAVTAGELSNAAVNAHAGKTLASSETSRVDQTSLDDTHSGPSSVVPSVVAPPLPPPPLMHAVGTGNEPLETKCEGNSSEGDDKNSRTL